jgi:hypothetical protein
MHRVKRFCFVAAMAGSSALVFTARAMAEDAEDSESTAVDETAGETTVGESSSATDEAPSASAQEAKPGDSEASAALGLRYRGVLLPKPVMGWFLEGGKTVYVNGVGPELSIPDGDGEYLLSAWLAFYSMSPVAIKGSGDEEAAWEIVESQMKSLYLTVDYVWHTPLTGGLALSYGGGAGLGILFGALNRTQAWLEPGGSPGDPADYSPCSGIGVPDPIYCDDVNEHYDGYEEPNWFEGGSKPALFPWLSGQVGLRYQAHEKVVTRLDIGVATTGLFLGLGADYSL